MLNLEKLMEELGAETEEKIIEMMNDPFNTNPIIVELRELFEALDKGCGDNESKR